MPSRSLIRRLVVPLLLLVAVALIAFIIWLADDPNRPRFVPARSQSVSGPLKSLNYGFLNLPPFEGGKMWISVTSDSGGHVYLFDIEKRAILGELLRGQPAFMNGDQTKVVAWERTSAARLRRSLRGRLQAWLARFSGGRVRPPTKDDTDNLWLVDLKRNSAVHLGSVAQHEGIGSILIPSPGFNRGFIKPTVSHFKPGFYVWEHKSLTEFQFDGEPLGWWDDKRILFRATNNDFVLYDIVQRAASPFLSNAQFAKAFTEAKVVDGPLKAGVFIGVFHVWNGRENVFYLTDNYKRWQATNSYLFKVQRPDGGLKLVSPHFKFEESGQFNTTETLYVYIGREAGQSNSAVFLRDLAANTNVALVQDGGGNPQFYRDGVIYVRSNALWRVDLTGSNVTRLFPPEVGANK